jgi:magnesium transporter
MSDESVPTQPWNDLEILVAHRDEKEVLSFLSALPPADVARAISRLSEEGRGQLLTLIEPHEAADLLEGLPDAQGADLIEDLPAGHAAAIVGELDSDHRVDLLGEMSKRDAQAILNEMTPGDAAEARRLMEYEPDTAGGLMVTEFVAYRQNLTVTDVLQDLRANAKAYSDFLVQYAYVRNESGRLVGVLRIHDLVLSPGDKLLKDVMIANPISVLVDTPLQELEQHFDRYQFSGLPVVEHDGSIVGVVQRVDTEEALSERAEQVFMRFSGIFGRDELRHLPLINRSMGRVWWLGINLVLSFVSASMIVLFEDTVNKLIALAAIMTVQSNVCGISGNQAVAVSIREMTLGLIQPRDFFRVMTKEIAVGLVNGVCVGLLLGAIVYAWKRDLLFAGVVAAALNLNMVIAVILGGCIPLLARRLGFDPAVASPMLTTLTDICGFFLTLFLATMILL